MKHFPLNGKRGWTWLKSPNMFVFVCKASTKHLVPDPTECHVKKIVWVVFVESSRYWTDRHCLHGLRMCIVFWCLVLCSVASLDLLRAVSISCLTGRDSHRSLSVKRDRKRKRPTGNSSPLPNCSESSLLYRLNKLHVHENTAKQTVVSHTQLQ